MREIAYSGEIDEISVIRYIINGVADKEENKVLLYGARSFYELKQKFLLYEDYKKRTKLVDFDMGKKKLPINKSGSNIAPGKSKASRCFNCGSPDHKKAQCKKTVKCFKCGEQGHISPNCAKSDQNKERNINTHNQVNLVNKSIMEKIVYMNQYKVNALIDTGSDVTLIREDIFIKFKNICVEYKTLNLTAFGGKTCTTKGYIVVTMSIDNVKREVKCHIVSKNHLNVECIVGKNFIIQTNMTVNKDGVRFYHNSINSDADDGSEIMQI